MDLRTDPKLNRQQAEWTRPMRRELYRRVRLASLGKVLDVGCGDGLVTEEMASICRGQVTGVDRDPAMIETAYAGKGKAEFRAAEVEALPFPSAHFDLVTCHWLIMWLDDVNKAIEEFLRVLVPGGKILFACEPDYGGMIAHPPEIDMKNELIMKLKSAGADPFAGRKLAGLLAGRGMHAKSGLYPGAFGSDTGQEIIEGEIAWLSSVLPDAFDSDKADLVRKAHQEGTLVMHTPTFWAIGSRPL